MSNIFIGEVLGIKDGQKFDSRKALLKHKLH